MQRNKMMTSTEIRQSFLDFFISKGHTLVSSAPIVIKDDPTLLFTNAGMNQFKDFFLGNKTSLNKRVVDTQKCLRVSGKQNDLEEVGVDTYHHTMFEMLGNWSFGDYFKEEAIEWSWELLTKVYNISKDRLYVTIFEGDLNEGLEKDEESITFWEKWIDKERIIPGNKKDNFWEMGDTGPCGPCTEIHVDCRPREERIQTPGYLLVNKDHPQVIEIWNNVFIQYNRKKDGSLESLPARHVDTGMGLERLVRVLQQKDSNYDTDVFSGIISEVEKLSGKLYLNSNTKKDVAFRVIADHIRAIVFPIADGQLPSNTGAGYVIRRILRRAVRYYFSYLEVKEPFLFKLTPLISEQFKHVFPEVSKQSDFIARVIHEEENNFLKTLDKGLHRIEEIIKTTKTGNINGIAAFELFDTYGFPLDLTRLIANENNLSVDEHEFEEQMDLQRARSRKAGLVDTEDWVILEDGTSNFIGYTNSESNTRALKFRKTRNQGKEAYQIVLENTPFYAESGGQVGDIGQLSFNNTYIKVVDTKRENHLILHVVEELPERLEYTVVAAIDTDRRKDIEVHHTSTHLLHAALREVLGSHVSQKGSLVNEEYLRFDFSHFSKVSVDELALVEKIVNEKIRQNIPVITKELPKNEAIKLGAMALFGEKYGDIVRVVIIDPDYSIEFCGGTHVISTAELGIFKINSETAVGSGLRRIEAVSGRPANELINKRLSELNDIKEYLRNPKDIRKAILQSLAEKDTLNKLLHKMEARHISELGKELLTNKVEPIGRIKFIGQIVEVINPDSLKKLCLSMKENLENTVLVIASEIASKAHVAVMMDEKIVLSSGLNATTLIKDHIATLIKGGGGGNSTLATAGGQDASKLHEVIQVIRQLYANL